MPLDAQTCNFSSISCSYKYVVVSIIIYQYSLYKKAACACMHGHHDATKKAPMEHEVFKVKEKRGVVLLNLGVWRHIAPRKI